MLFVRERHVTIYAQLVKVGMFMTSNFFVSQTHPITGELPRGPPSQEANSLGMTPSPDVDKNHSKGAFCACVSNFLDM